MKHPNKNRMGKIGRVTALSVMLLALSPSISLAQVTMKVQNATVKNVIQKIQKQTKSQFFYSSDVAKLRTSAINVKNASVEATLRQAFQGTGIVFTKNGNTYYLKKEREEEKGKSSDTFPVKRTEKQKITGVVTDDNKEPLIGVTITVKGTND